MRILIAAASLILFSAAMFLTSFIAAGPNPPERITVIANEQARRVDISIDGQPFTSYIWPATLKKPVLYPLRTTKGTIVTRGFLSSSAPANASITRITPAFGSTTRASMASILE